MTGVIPSDEFNEQIKRTVRESMRRSRGETFPRGRWHKKGSGGGGTFARGEIVEVNCYDGGHKVTLERMSRCAAIPSLIDGTDYDVIGYDVDGIGAGHTDDELLGASVRLHYLFDLTSDTCAITGQWEIISIVGIDVCADPLGA